MTRCGTKGLPVASSASSSSKRPLAVPTISAFAVSIALPPPTATIISHVGVFAPEPLVHRREPANVGIGVDALLDTEQRSADDAFEPVDQAETRAPQER